MILFHIYRFQRARIPFTKEQIATLCKFSNVRSMTNVIPKLERYITKTRSGNVPYVLNELGIQYVCETYEGMDLEINGDQGNAKAQEVLRDMIAQGIQTQIFDLLCDGKTYAIADLQERFGYDNPRSFGNIIGKLVTATVAERPAKGQVRAVEKAFPFGRPK